jgi:hypothetical protein
MRAHTQHTVCLCCSELRGLGTFSAARNRVSSLAQSAQRWEVRCTHLQVVVRCTNTSRKQRGTGGNHARMAGKRAHTKDIRSNRCLDLLLLLLLRPQLLTLILLSLLLPLILLFLLLLLPLSFAAALDVVSAVTCVASVASATRYSGCDCISRGGAPPASEDSSSAQPREKPRHGTYLRVHKELHMSVHICVHI